jgi:hypothetical protein
MRFNRLQQAKTGLRPGHLPQGDQQLRILAGRTGGVHVVRTHENPSTMVRSIAAAVHAIDPTIAVA